jgi:selenium metabolism protein YedF
MKSFFYTLTQMKDAVTALIFINSGVALTSQGSEVLDHLLELEQVGVEILSCGTCLDFYHLKNRLMVGQVSNMYSILERVSAADKVITI